MMTDKILVLYVDDEPALRDIGKLFLERTGHFSVVTIDSASAALALLKKERFDAVVSDYQMPGINGIAFLKSVRALGDKISFIIFTGRGREEIAIEALNNGADFYIQKGGEPKSQFVELAHKIQTAVDRRRTEEALAESEERFRGITERISDLIIVVDPQGYSTFVSPSITAILGFSPELYLKKRVDSISIPIEDTEKLEQAFERLNSGSLAEHLDFRMKKSDGSYAVFDGRALPVFKEGVYAGIQLVARDITDRKHAEEALQQANRKLHLLSGITRHDIKNQLMVLLEYLELLQKKVPDPALEEYFTRLIHTSERIATMIQMTKTYENIGVNAPVWQDTRMLFDTTVKDIPVGKIICINDIPDGIEIFADPLIVKVCYNLIDNAVRYGKKITNIRFSVMKRNDDTVFICEDDGVGVPVDVKEKIFDRGFGKNTGLGLALSREILDITGIKLHETGEPGKGARFEMTVPKRACRFGATR
ncbi:MAG: response regulator [Methanoregula sp.]